MRLNKCQFTGNVGKEPEIKVLNSGKKVAQFSLAINDGYYGKDGEWVDRTYWVRITAWEKTAEIVESKIGKGTSVYIEGRLTIGEYEDKDGNKRTSVDIVANNIQLLEKKAATEKKAEKNPEPQDEDDLPF